MKKFLMRVFEIYGPFKKAVGAMFIFIILQQAITLAYPFLYGKVIDAIVSKKELLQVLLLAVISLLLHAIGALLGSRRNRFELDTFDFKVPDYVSKITLDKVLGFSIGQHINENSGIKRSIISRGEHSLRTLAYTIAYDIMPLSVQVLLTIAALLWLNLVLGVIVAVSVILFIGVSIFLNLMMEDELKKLQEMDHENGKIHGEIFRNIEVVQVNSQEKRVINEYGKHFEKFSLAGIKLWKKYDVLALLRQGIVMFGDFAVMAIGAWYVFNGKYTPGYLVVFLSWSSGAFGRLGQFGDIHRRCMELYTAVNKYFTLLDVDPAVKIIPNPVKPKIFNGRIEFKNVSFKYPYRSYVDESGEDKDFYGEFSNETLQNISFVIEAGQKVAFVGHSGAGKSTIAQLMLRAYDPDLGQVMVDNNDLRVLDLKTYRENTGFVEQNVCLFDNSLRYNITFGLNGKGENITEEYLGRIAKIACIDKFSSRLEKGFDTIIGEKGVKLSGGERQRVGIARALIKEPNILILDEATSNLDAENENIIRQSIENASQGRTTVIIAHRLSTIRNVDKIFVVENGRIVGEGVHDELLCSCEAYQNLINNQVVAI